jgi:hypothetical protein
VAYIADCYGELRPLDRVGLVSNELPASPTSLGLLGGDLGALVHQI